MLKKPILQIILWLGLMALLTLLAMGIWFFACGGSQSTVSLKWLQLLQTFGTFLLPAVIGAWLWSDHHQPFVWLRLNSGISCPTALLAVAIMLCAIPGINLLADLNSNISLPKSLDFIEHFLRQQEDAAAELTRRFLQADNFGIMLLNVGLMALLPALAEEISFRGTLQQILNFKTQNTNTHMAIWVTAFLFSAIHMQFYGFIPRMLMGAMFGYVFVWTDSLWAPVLMHFTNNGLAVVSYYLLDEGSENGSVATLADTIGTGTMWWLGLVSMIVVGALLYWLRRLNHSRRYSCSG